MGTPRAPAGGQHRPPGSGEPQMPGPGDAIRSHFLRASEPGVSERAQTDTRSPEVAHGSDAEAASVADCGVVSRRRGRSPRAAGSRRQERAGLPFHRTGRCSGFAPTGTRCPLPPQVPRPHPRGRLGDRPRNPLGPASRPDARAGCWIPSQSQDVPLGLCWGTGLDGGAWKAGGEAGPVGSESVSPRPGRGAGLPACLGQPPLTNMDQPPDRPALRLGGS